MAESRKGRWVRKIKAGSVIEMNGTSFTIDRGAQLTVTSHIDRLVVDGRLIIDGGETVARRAAA